MWAAAAEAEADARGALAQEQAAAAAALAEAAARGAAEVTALESALEKERGEWAEERALLVAQCEAILQKTAAAAHKLRRQQQLQRASRDSGRGGPAGDDLDAAAAGGAPRGLDAVTSTAAVVRVGRSRAFAPPPSLSYDEHGMGRLRPLDSGTTAEDSGGAVREGGSSESEQHLGEVCGDVEFPEEGPHGELRRLQSPNLEEQAARSNRYS